MLYLKAITYDGRTEYFNTKNILTITEYSGGDFKVLMGAGLYYNIKGDSVEFVEMENIFNKK